MHTHLHICIFTSQHNPPKALSLILSPLMDFFQLTSNHKNKALSENPFLLEVMERNQFIHSKNSPFKTYNPKQQPFKKTKRNFKSHSIPFYQSSKF